MSLATKKTKATGLGIDLTKIEGEVTEEKLDELIEAKTAFLDQEKKEAKIKAEAEKAAAEEAKKNQIILRDVDGADVDQSEYFFPRDVDEIDEKTQKVIHKATNQTAPANFNKMCGMPVEREELIEVFLRHFPRRKGFLFYKSRNMELYLIIVPLKYATTINKATESRPGDFQRHALSFVSEGSVNVDSLNLKLGRIAKHTSISTEALD